MLVSGLICGFCGEVSAVNPPPPFARSPYLQMGGPSRMGVVWRTEGPIVPGVRFGKALGNLDREVHGVAIQSRASLGAKDQKIPAKWESLLTEENRLLPRLHSAPVGTFQYEAQILELEPDTTYYYGIFDGEKRLTPEDASYRFTTHPIAGPSRPVRFWIVGDGGTGKEPQAAVSQSMLKTVEAEKHPLDFWIHVGDMAYFTGRDNEFQSRFFEMYDTTLRNKVCWATMGNHEGATSSGRTGIGPYYDAWPSGWGGIGNGGLLFVRLCEHPFYLPRLA